ncbi:MAG: transglycosylase domain-containing protein, partial [Bacteroidota bacterium]|nr:transglycosylase domain-containing protein [Bacteroidota bacterium]
MTKKNHKNHISSRNKTRRKQAKKPFSTWRFLIKLGIQLLLLGIFLSSFFVLLVWLGMFGSLPGKEDLTNIENHTASEVFTSDGKLMGRYFIENRLTIGNKNISPHLINALIATEDSRFFEHKGIDYISLGRVLFKTMIARNKSQGGGSTISQQLARNLFPRTGNSMFDLTVNKVKETIIANRLEKIYNKDQILNLYLNTVSFGEEIFGIETASQRFFSKSAGDLYPYEAATLVGMLAANTAYSPRLYPEQSRKRRNIVLRRMAEQGWIDSGDYSKWINEPIHLNYRRIDHNTGIAPYFRDILQKELESYLKNNFEDSINLYTDGLRIYTSIESGIQAYADYAVLLQMNRLQKEFNEHWKNQSPWDESTGLFIETVRKSSRYQRLLADGHNENEIMHLLAKPISTLPGDPEGKAGKLSPLDSIRQSLLTLHAGFLAIDPATGYILAWVGGIDH